MAEKDTRTRNWTFVLYPDSAPVGWYEELCDLHVPFAVSPLHEFDSNPDGEQKKPHYHVVLAYEGKKSYEQLLDITHYFGAPIPKRVESMVGMIRYLVHLDNPEKHQYSWSDCRFGSGFDPQSYMMPSRSERYRIIREMQSWIRESGCKEFSVLFDEAAENHLDDWFPLLCDNSAVVMSQYIQSVRHAKAEAAEAGYKAAQKQYLDFMRAQVRNK